MQIMDYRAGRAEAPTSAPLNTTGPEPPDLLTDLPKLKVEIFLWTFTILHMASTLHNFFTGVIINMEEKMHTV